MFTHTKQDNRGFFTDSIIVLIVVWLAGTAFCVEIDVNRASVGSVITTGRVLKPAKPQLTEMHKLKLDESLSAAKVPQATKKQLQDANITTLPELRKKVFSRDKALTKLPPDQLTKLHHLSLLSLVSLDPNLNAELAKSDFDSIGDLTKLSPEELQKRSKGKLGKEEAESISKKAKALKRLLELNAKDLVAACQDHRRMQQLPSELQELLKTLCREVNRRRGEPNEVGVTEESGIACVGPCDSEKDIFSPAFYLVYLLDFVEKTYAPDLDSLDKIDKRFFQRFENLPVSQETDQVDTYVRFANEVLENYIAELDGNPWPNDGSTMPQQRRSREYIYNTEFSSSSYAGEPNFNANLLSDMFDSYLMEMGTTRKAMRLVRGLPRDDLKRRVAMQQGLEIVDEISVTGVQDPNGLRISDIDLLGSDDINLAMLDGIRDKKLGAGYGTLYRWHWRKAKQALTQERIIAIQNELRATFDRHYRGLRSTAIDCVYAELVKQIPPNTDDPNFEILLAQKREDAKACVNGGEANCPSVDNCLYVSKPFSLPLLPLRELFRHYAATFPPPPGCPECVAEPDTNEAGLCADIQNEGRRTEIEMELRAVESLDPNTLLPNRAQQRVEERLASEEEFEYQLGRLAEEVFKRDMNDGGKADFDAEVEIFADGAWRDSVAKAEAGFHAKIRTNLLTIILQKLKNKGAAMIDSNGSELLTDVHIQRLADLLLLDLTVDESYRTTPLAAAISRIHSFVQAVRLGKLRYPADKFDKEVWGWLQSYGIWHAAMMVTAYPENFIIPEVRRNATEQFTELKDNMESQTKIDPSGLVGTWTSAYDELAHMALAGTVAVDPCRVPGSQAVEFASTYVFGWTNRPINNSIYVSKFSRNGEWDSWKKVDDLNDFHAHRILVKSFDKNVYFFAIVPKEYTSNKVKWTLKWAKIAIEDLGVDPIPSLDWDEVQEVEIATNSSNEVYTHLFLKRRAMGGFVVYYVDAEVGELKRWALRSGADGSLEFEAPTGELYLSALLKDVTGATGCRDDDGKYPDPTGPYGFVWIKGSSVYVGGWYHADLVASDANLESMLRTVGQNFGGVFTQDTGFLEDWRFLLFYSPCTKCTAVLEITKTLSGTSYRTVSTKVSTSTEMTPLAIELIGSTPHIFGRISNGCMVFSAIPSIRPKKLTASAYQSNIVTTVDDPVRVYEDEKDLHIPMLVAERLSEAGRYQEAMEWLSKVYNPMLWTEELRQRWPGFSEGGNATAEIGRWLEDPFNPYALADMHKETYLQAVRFAHVQNLLDWADHLFAMDTTESVNRARQLYELAAEVLGLTEWSEEGCAINLGPLVTQADTAGMSSSQQKRLKEALGNQSKGASQQAEEKVKGILSSQRSSESKIAAIKTFAKKKAKEDAIGSFLEQQDSKEIQKLLEQLIEKVLAEMPEETAQGVTEAAQGIDEVTIGREFPGVDLRFCLPLNPLVKVIRWRIESNLTKIRTNRNFAGMPRQLQPYATPVDPKKLVKQAASGGIEFEEYIPSLPPPIYRYSFLVERAKQLAQVAQQLENSMLSSIKEGEEAEYRLMQAQQDVRLERTNVTLQGLRVTEAMDGKTLAEKQKERAELSRDHYEQLIGDMVMSALEILSLSQMEESLSRPDSVSITASSTGPSVTVGYSPSGKLTTMANISSTLASYERRRDEWQYQFGLAEKDIAIADAGITLTDDRIDIAEQEKGIAEFRLENANDTVEFLHDRFLNKALYRWMDKNLSRLYREQLNMAISTAKAAQQALEFERQTSFDFIGYDYWDDEKRGILAAERLFKDIEKMNEFRLSTATRKKEIEKTISLSSSMPAEFQKFRKTGIFDFETSMKWFDRDFPGHYMRLIRDVSVSVIALVPPNEGIHATLSNTGISRVMVGPPFEQLSVLYRLPESVALSSPYKATGLFELRSDDPMLFPFEGSGVATMWRLEMPKGANRFDYDSLYDVLLTVRYTALEDRDYRSKVLADMGQDEEGFVKTGAVRYFSLSNDFVDQWYYLLNPVLGLDPNKYWNPAQQIDANDKQQLPYTVVLEVKASDFVPNEEQKKIKKVTLAMQIVDGQEDLDWSLQVNPFFKSETSSTIEKKDMVTLTIDKFTGTVEGLNGKRPYGRWVFCFGNQCEGTQPSTALSNTDMANYLKKRVKDIWLIIEYEAAVHYNR